MADRKMVRIEFEFEDGEILRHTGENAEVVNRWVNDLHVDAMIHGNTYQGPKPEQVAPPRPVQPS